MLTDGRTNERTDGRKFELLYRTLLKMTEANTFTSKYKVYTQCVFKQRNGINNVNKVQSHLREPWSF